MVKAIMITDVTKFSTDEIMAKMATHLTEALMFHSEMNDYFNFLNLWGFKELHQYQYFDESIGKIKFHNNFINQFNRLIDTKGFEIEKLDVIPLSWYNNSRMDVNNDNMSLFVKDGWKAYVSWEEETKKLYSQICSELLKRNEFSKYNIVLEYLKDVNEELKMIYKIQIELNNCGYDATYILDMQDKLYDMYHEKMKHLKVD